MSLNGLVNGNGTTNRTFLPNLLNYRGLWDASATYNAEDVVSDTAGNWWSATVDKL